MLCEIDSYSISTDILVYIYSKVYSRFELIDDKVDVGKSFPQFQGFIDTVLKEHLR